MTNHWKTIADIRREYGKLALSEKSAHPCPMAQFEAWFADVVKTEKSDPTAMVLSTVDEYGHPDSRVVLLKETTPHAFVFYTNYNSTKSKHVSNVPYVALNFYWPEMARQVRVRGIIQKISSKQSDDYFASRPKLSQLSAIASPQSSEISGREQLECNLNALITDYAQQPILRPENWGGYEVLPEEFEFWQGRDNRLHDRIQYFKQNGKWLHRRLAP